MEQVRQNVDADDDADDADDDDDDEDADDADDDDDGDDAHFRSANVSIPGDVRCS